MNTSAGELTLWGEAQIVQVQGDAALDFLQGYLTCNTDRLSADELTPMAMCNVKGRTIVSGWAYLCDAQVQLIVHKTLAETTVEFLTPFARFHRCQLEVNQNKSVYITTDASSSFAVFDQYLTILSHQATDADQSTASLTEFELSLVRHNFVFLRTESSARHLPQALGLAAIGALDFDKGCYLGQEIVARAEFRGALKRGLSQFSWAPSAPRPQVGQSYTNQDTKIDDVLSVVAGHGLGVHKLT